GAPYTHSSPNGGGRCHSKLQREPALYNWTASDGGCGAEGEKHAFLRRPGKGEPKRRLSAIMTDADTHGRLADHRRLHMDHRGRGGDPTCSLHAQRNDLFIRVTLRGSTQPRD